ncbi:MAG: hypothetical protein ACI9FU_001355 [Granulosicoccus sp.]|jgi:hypothetical protein
MESNFTKRLLTLTAIVIFAVSTSCFSQEAKPEIKLRTNHAFKSNDWALSIGSSFLSYAYGYGGHIEGVPLVLSFEYGVHRYFGTGIYAGMLHRTPSVGERSYKQSVYSAGVRFNGHFYNAIDDLIKKANLKSNIIDMYVSVNLGMEHMVTNLPINKKTIFYIGVGFGLRAYPFKNKKIGLMTEIGHSVVSPWLLGATFRL